jgi:hypothetical protein
MDATKPTICVAKAQTCEDSIERSQIQIENLTKRMGAQKISNSEHNIATKVATNRNNLIVKANYLAREIHVDKLLFIK